MVDIMVTMDGVVDTRTIIIIMVVVLTTLLHHLYLVAYLVSHCLNHLNQDMNNVELSFNKNQNIMRTKIAQAGMKQLIDMAIEPEQELAMGIDI